MAVDSLERSVYRARRHGGWRVPCAAVVIVYVYRYINTQPDGSAWLSNQSGACISSDNIAVFLNTTAPQAAWRGFGMVDTF